MRAIFYEGVDFLNNILIEKFVYMRLVTVRSRTLDMYGNWARGALTSPRRIYTKRVLKQLFDLY